MQVYRGMDIGTAKPDPQLRSRIPHHLIDVRAPDEPYDVGAFVADATTAIDAILAPPESAAPATVYFFSW